MTENIFNIDEKILAHARQAEAECSEMLQKLTVLQNITVRKY